MDATWDDGSGGPFLSERQLAWQLGCSIATVRRWRTVREGPAYLKLGRLVRYSPQDVERWLADHLHLAGGSEG